jgi:nicotinate-nucleotide adenylyltransferase
VTLNDLRSVGILGGTFNPPHIGHLALARRAHAQLRLQRVLLTPASIAPNKPAPREDPGAGHRLAMCGLAVAQDPALEASALEVERGGVSYTVDTLQAIHEMHPEAELTLIVGADTARTLPSWREPEQLLQLASLAVAERDELDGQAITEALAGLHPAPQITMLAMERIPVSSSQVRELVGAGKPVVKLVGEGVAGYIAEHGLYRSAATPPATPAPDSAMSSGTMDSDT